MSSVELEPQDLPDVAHPNHGRTRAGWVTTSGLVVATLLGSLGLSLVVPTLMWAGIVVAVLSLVAGIALRALGHGQPLR